jgi:hypothetical protein
MTPADPRQLTPATLAAVQTALVAQSHRPRRPFGNRATDPQLAMAVLTGHLGLRRAAAGAVETVLQRARATLRAFPGLPDGHPRRAAGGLRGLWQRLQRVWYLRRALQVDQGTTPWCVDANRCHWQLALPTYGRLTHPLGELYAECKKIDPWPGEDGTSMWYMVQVLERLDLVTSSWWYQGPADADAALRWLSDTGGLSMGANWPEDAFRTRRLADGTTDGVIDVADDAEWLYGHEVFLIGREKNYRHMGPHIQGVQSWGLDNYGIRGRFWIPEADFLTRWLSPTQGAGDLCGLVERPAAA